MKRFYITCYCNFLWKNFFYKYHWFLYLFGIFFILTVLKTFFFKRTLNNKNRDIPSIFNRFRVTQDINDKKFFCIIDKKLFF